jgi:hypothetical protein
MVGCFNDFERSLARMDRGERGEIVLNVDHEQDVVFTGCYVAHRVDFLTLH